MWWKALFGTRVRIWYADNYNLPRIPRERIERESGLPTLEKKSLGVMMPHNLVLMEQYPSGHKGTALKAERPKVLGAWVRILPAPPYYVDVAQ